MKLVVEVCFRVHWGFDSNERSWTLREFISCESVVRDSSTIRLVGAGNWLKGYCSQRDSDEMLVVILQDYLVEDDLVMPASCVERVHPISLFL